jgi:hypothetical protein
MHDASALPWQYRGNGPATRCQRVGMARMRGRPALARSTTDTLARFSISTLMHFTIGTLMRFMNLMRTKAAHGRCPNMRAMCAKPATIVRVRHEDCATSDTRLVRPPVNPLPMRA